MCIDTTRSESNADKLNGYFQGLVDGQKQLLDKACDYLESALKHDLGYYGAADFTDTFRKAMER